MSSEAIFQPLLASFGKEDQNAQKEPITHGQAPLPHHAKAVKLRLICCAIGLSKSLPRDVGMNWHVQASLFNADRGLVAHDGEVLDSHRRGWAATPPPVCPMLPPLFPRC